MFDKYLQRVNENISTVRKIIETNDRLRKFLFVYKNTIQQESEKDNEEVGLKFNIDAKKGMIIYIID